MEGMPKGKLSFPLAPLAKGNLQGMNMITIVTGDINSRKTTKLLSHYGETKRGDGFVSVKVLSDNRVQGYQAMLLSTQETRDLLVHEAFYAGQFEKRGNIGPFVINSQTLDWVEAGIIKMIETRTEPIYLDEIGQLELNKMGFDAILRRMIASKLDLVLVVRTDFLDQVIKAYHLEKAKIITAF